MCHGPERQWTGQREVPRGRVVIAKEFFFLRALKVQLVGCKLQGKTNLRQEVWAVVVDMKKFNCSVLLLLQIGVSG